MRTFLALLLLCVPASAQPIPCAPYDEMVAKLAKSFKEHPVGGGIVSNQAIVEVLVSVTGSFTILTVRIDGLACIVASGDAWEIEPAGEAL